MITAEATHSDKGKIETVFDHIVQKLKVEAITHDAQLANGKLSKSSVAALFRATYLESCINHVETEEIEWNPERTFFLSKIATWNRGESKRWAREAAQYFLEACAENGFGVRFY